MSEAQSEDRPQAATTAPQSGGATPKASPELVQEGEAIVSALAQILLGKIDPAPSKPSVAETPPPIDETARLQEAAKAEAEQRRKDEEARHSEAAKAEAEQRRKDEEARQAEAAKAEAEQRRKDEEARQAEAAKAEAEQRRKDEEARQAEAAKAEAEQRRKDEEARQAEAAKQRQATKASEPQRNAALNGRIDKLTAGGFKVDLLRTRYNAVRVPKTEVDAGLDAREQARAALAADLDVAEQFKPQAAALKIAEQAVEKMFEPLKKGFRASHPPVSSIGIVDEAALANIKASAAAIAGWCEAVGRAPTYVSALQTFDTTVASAGATKWPFTAKARAAAETTAEDAASKGSSLDGACRSLTDSIAVINAAGPFRQVQKRVQAKRAQIPVVEGDADFGKWLDGLLADPAKAEALSVATFEARAKELTDAEASIEPCTKYLAMLVEARAEFEEVKRLVTPATKVASGKADIVLEKAIGAALAEGNGFYFDKAAVKASEALALLKTARTDRNAAVLKRASDLLGSAPTGKATAGKLAGVKDPGGHDLVSELYLQFGEAGFKPALDGFKPVVNDPTKSAAVNATNAAQAAAEKIEALAASIGVKGIKELTTALGANPGAGAGSLGEIMQHGMTDDQVGALHEKFDLAEPDGQLLLKQLYGTSFRGKSETFAKIVGKGMKMPGDDDDTAAVGRAADMATAFDSPADLRTVVDGLVQTDPAVRVASAGLNAAQLKKLDSEQCDVAANRMDSLLQIHFGGNATELKTMFDRLAGYPTEERAALEAARDAYEDYEDLSPKEKKAQKAPVYTADMDKRLTRLNAVGGGKPSMDVLIRNASTLETAGSAGKFAGMGNEALSTERLEHFARHTRAMNTLQPPNDLAPASTPIDDPDDKPTSFWPEGMDAALLDKLVRTAMGKAGEPPGGWYVSSEQVKDWFYPTGSQGKFQRTTRKRFLQFDTAVDYPMKTGGADKTVSIGVRLGAEVFETRDRTTGPNPQITTNVEKKLTQCYPLSGPRIDTLSFEDMQAVKTALGRRKI